MPFGLDSNFYIKVLPLIVIEGCFFYYAFTSDLRTYQTVLGLVGLWWCLAALWVEVKIEHAYPGFQYNNPTDPEMKDYRPFCDFAPWATCSKVLMSPPGRFLRYFGIARDTSQGKSDGGIIDFVRSLIDVPNPTLGVLFFGCHLFYPALLMIPILNDGTFKPLIPWAFFAACAFVGLMTVWLAYNLFCKLKDFCVVCVSMYVANFALIPMMYNIAIKNWSYADYNPFFGRVPNYVLYPFLTVDAIMFVAVVGLYMSGPTAHARTLPDCEALYERMADDSRL